MSFLGFEHGAPVFDFDAVRAVGETRLLSRHIRDEGVRRFRCAMPIEPDAFGDERMAATLDAHLNAHFGGQTFEIEWPQHLGTVPNRTISLSADAPAGATVLAANMGDAAPSTRSATETIATAALSLRVARVGHVGSPDAAGEWQFVGSGLHDETLHWADVEDAAIGILFFAAALPGVAPGDTARFAQGARTADWVVTGVNFWRSVVSIGFHRPPAAFAGGGDVANAGAATVKLLRTTIAESEPDAPLVPGRFVTVGTSAKLHQVVALSDAGFTVSPSLLADAPRGALVETSPVVPVRYAPDMDTQSVYSLGVLSRRTVVVEEAL